MTTTRLLADQEVGNYYTSDGRFVGDIYSTQEKRILESLYYVTPPLSLLGSALLLYALVAGQRAVLRNRVSPTYVQLLGGFAVMDVMQSVVWLVLGPWAMPQGTPYGVSARGSQALCNVKGFFFSLTLLGLPTYSTCLAIFYVLTVKYEVKDERMVKYYQPIFVELLYL